MLLLNLFGDKTIDLYPSDEENEALLLRKVNNNLKYQLTPVDVEKLRKLDAQLLELEQSIRSQLDDIAKIVRSASEASQIPYQLLAETKLDLHAHTSFSIRENGDGPLSASFDISHTLPLYPATDLYESELKDMIPIPSLSFQPGTIFTQLIENSWLCWEDFLKVKEVHGVTVIKLEQFLELH
ncbi:hypothetical protein MD537_06900 [Flavihumibacter sediminis]|nr:hypothetical protein [Flavihumibacter sediminis]